MNETVRLRILYAAAFSTFVVGGVLAAHAMHKLVEIRAGVIRTRGAIQEATKLQADLGTHDRARERVGKALATSLSGQEELLANVLGEVQPKDISPLERKSFGNGWVKLTQRLTFKNVDIENVMTCVENAERLRPPWRLVSCDIQALPTLSGRGHVILSLSTIQRAP